MMKVGVFCGQLGLVPPPTTPYLSHCTTKCTRYSFVLRIHNNPSRHGASPLKLGTWGPNYAAHKSSFVVASASSAPSVSGSGAEYSGNLGSSSFLCLHQTSTFILHISLSFQFLLYYYFMGRTDEV